MPETKRALIIGHIHLPSFQIGIAQPFRRLRRWGVCSYACRTEQTATAQDIANADIVVFFRSYHPEALALLRQAQQMGKRTVYAVDDHFSALSRDTELGRHFFSMPAYKQAYLQFLSSADVVRVASPYMAKHVRKHFRVRRVVCVPGSVKFSLFEGLRRKRRTDGVVVIGYEGGEKASAFAPVAKALARVLRRYGGRVRLEFYGYMPPELHGLPGIKHVRERLPYQPFLKKLYTLGWDIGLAPLDNTLFHKCKTNNKFREYAACGIAGIYSNTPAYADSVTHRKDGYIVPHTEAGWYDGIKKLIEQPGLRKEIARRARRKAQKTYTVSACAQQWRKHILKI